MANTVELAARIARRCRPVIDGPASLPETPLRDFWRFSRHRLYDWMSALRHGRPPVCRHPARGAAYREGEMPRLLEEILVSDVLMRVWLAVLSAAADARNNRPLRRLSRHLFLGHLQVRCLALEALSPETAVERREAARLNVVRRKAERWTDLLLGPLVVRCDVSDFAHDEQRSRDFASVDCGGERGEGRPERAASAGRSETKNRLVLPRTGPPHAAFSLPVEPAWELTLAGIRRAFPPIRPSSPFRTACQRRIVSSIIATCPPGLLSTRPSVSSAVKRDE